MNLKSSLALAAALMMTGAAFAADTLAPNAATTPQATPSVTGAGLAQTQTDGVSKDSTTSTTTQESTTGATTGSAQVKEDPSKASPAVETSAAGTASQTSSSPNHVEKLFHMFQQDKQQSQAGATTPEAKPGDSSSSNPAAKTAQ